MENIEKIVAEIKKRELFEDFSKNCEVDFVCSNLSKAFFTITVRNFEGGYNKYSMCAELIDIDIDEEEDDYEIIHEIEDVSVNYAKERIDINKTLSSCGNFIKHLSKEESEWVSVHSLDDTSSPCGKLYYILEIYDCSQPLCHEMETKIYSRDEIKEIIYSVCNAVKFCHSMNIYHNNISIYNIYAKDNVYKLGRISTNKKLYPNSTDISAETDIAMICRFIGEIAHKLKINKKNADIVGVLERISANSSRYNNTDEIFADLKISKGKKKHLKYIAIPVVLIIAVSALCFVFLKRNSTEHTLGDVNFDGKIDASDSSCVLSYYASLATKKTISLTNQQKECADVNSDGTVDATDASAILYFYTYRSAGNAEITFEEWLHRNK